jgi:F-type H+-transporting ATPase subunit b
MVDILQKKLNVSSYDLPGRFNPIKPEFGLFFWTTLFFILFWWLIGKYAFRPITESLKQREHDIQDAIDSAKRQEKK